MYVQSIYLDGCLAGTEHGVGSGGEVWSLFICIEWVLQACNLAGPLCKLLYL